MRFGSVASGIEAASVAFGPLGWKAAWFSEIEPFPCALLAHHYPDVPNLGDMTALPDMLRLGLVEAPDMLCGGTPCQAFSVAGLRQSLDDARGNLSLVFCEIANAIDDVRRADGQEPATIFWENVPGVLSTKDNAFGCFLAGLAGEDAPVESPGGKWPNAGFIVGPKRAVAWRVLDAQYFGVAQRRRRVFVVASARDHFDPAEVLFEFEGLRRDTAPRRETGKGIAQQPVSSLDASFGRLQGCSGQDANHGHSHLVAFGGNDTRGPIEVATARNACASASGRMDFESETFLVSHSLRGEGFDASEDGTGRGTPLVPVTQPYTLAIRGRGDSHNLEYRTDGTANALLTPNGGRGGIGVGAVAFSHQAGGTQTTLGYDPQSDTSPCLNKSQTPAIAGMQVRRLTPRECERLQGFPDDYTLIPHRGKPAADGPRYKALGNSWAVPVVRWIGRRIANQLSLVELV